MLKGLIRFSIDQAALVVLLATLLLAWAGYVLPDTPVDVFPDLNSPTVVVMTEAPGLAADEVEQYVTFRVETAARGVPGVRRVRTSSAMGLSIAYIEFGWDMDIYRARQLVGERLDAVREELPVGAHVEMTPITSITGEIMLLALSSPDESVTPLELRAYGEFELRNRLLSVPGVAQVSVIGGELPEYQVLVDPASLRLFGLTVRDVAEAAGAAHSTLSAGYLPNSDHLEIPIRQSGRVRSVKDLAGALVKIHDGAPVTLGQVAEVRLGPAPERGSGADDGSPAVILTLKKATGTNTLAITAEVDALLDELVKTIPKGMVINRQVFRQAEFINRAVHNVVAALRDAAIIVAIILLLFLLNLRTTLVTLTALPLSLAAGLLTLRAMGETINVMTLGGLAIAVGSLVDDAIIDVENVFRRLRQNNQLPSGRRKPLATVVFDASNEIRPAMVFATLLIALVFMPLMFLDGIEGRFFRPLGIAFVVSLVASLVVALTVTPAMCRLLLKGGKSPSHASVEARDDGEGPVVTLLKRCYDPVLRGALAARGRLMGVTALMTGLTLWLVTTFGSSFLPEFHEGTFMVGLFTPPGTSLAASERIASSVSEQILALESVDSVTRRTGRAERDEHAEPVSTSELDVRVASGFSMERVREQMNRILTQMPGVTANIGQPIGHRLSHILSGTPAAIAINVYGEDLHVLRVIAKDIERELEALPGARDIAANRELMIQSLPIVYRPANLAAYGLTPAGAASQVRDAVFGIEVAEIHEGTKRYDLTVRLRPEEREDPHDLSRMVLRGSDGALVRLAEVADIGPEMTSNLITREDSQRKAVISLNLAPGTNLGHLVDAVRERVDPIVAEYGYQVKYGGQFEAQQSAQASILWSGIIVLLLMVVILHLAIGSLVDAVLVLVNLPLAMIGGALALFIAESPSVFGNLSALLSGEGYVAPVLSIASLVGFITLFGIAVRNGILLVNHYRYLILHEQCSVHTAVRRGSMERLVPILMTALTAAFALAPLILQGDQPGNEILAPLSVVILGGLLTSTFLNLIIVPVGYAWIHGLHTQPPDPDSHA